MNAYYPGGYKASPQQRPDSRGPSRLGGSISRQSMGGLGGTALDGALNPSVIFKDRFSNITTAKTQIEKQRAKDQVREKLRIEFRDLDKD
jgi:hypothetical protein